MTDIVERLKKLMIAGPIHGSIAIAAINEIEKRDAALEEALAQVMSLREVLASFALFAQPAAVALAGGDPDKIATVLLEHKNQSISLSCFLMAREVFFDTN